MTTEQDTSKDLLGRELAARFFRGEIEFEFTINGSGDSGSVVEALVSPSPFHVGTSTEAPSCSFVEELGVLAEDRHCDLFPGWEVDEGSNGSATLRGDAAAFAEGRLGVTAVSESAFGEDTLVAGSEDEGNAVYETEFGEPQRENWTLSEQEILDSGIADAAAFARAQSMAERMNSNASPSPAAASPARPRM
ncbi:MULTISPECIES: hypothetical protein [unclassified Thioalkalivibrio]|uniref:hypothetical protein n=1 Tax=unclassified Thioalkalivibrio TaxID=2621013 RepID=UPI0003654F15|nr:MULTISPECIES: hypothetical protein [unclassified Thioalkalivibrio]